MTPLRIAVIVGCWTAPRQAIHQLPARRGHGKTQQDMSTMPQPEGFVRGPDTLRVADGNIAQASRDFLTKYMTRFFDGVQRHPKK